MINFRRLKIRGSIFFLFPLVAILVACAGDDEDAECPAPAPIGICPPAAGAGSPYTFEKPYFFPAPQLPGFNPMTEEGVELGRHLFWEKELSRDLTISCGSCHAPANAFTDHRTFSPGVGGALSRRNSMALINLAWNTSFFWDGRDTNLEQQILEPVSHPDEMDLAWSEAVSRIGQNATYQDMFTQAFGTPCVDSVRISYAIAQFLRTMVSARSKFDKARYYGEAMLTPAEVRGLELFLAEGGDPSVFPGGQSGGDCFHCHGGALVEFTDHQFRNNGLDSIIIGDFGREEVSGLGLDRGLFRTPTLRNIALTAPYMHDGRFSTIREVVEHYNSGGHDSQTLSPLMKFPDLGLGMSEQDIDDLVLFLESLTDEEFVADDRFSDPH